MNPAKQDHQWTRLKRALLVAAAAVGACLNVSAAIPVGGIAPNFTIKNHNTGQPLNLFDYQGCIVVLDFWAYWCGPCKSSAPDVETNIVQYYRNLGGNNHGVPVVVISVSVDNGNPTATQSFINAYGLELPADDTGNAYNWYGDGYIPYFAVLNGTTNATNLQQWQVLYSASGYNRNAIRSAIDSVNVPPPVIGTSGNLSFGEVVTGTTATATLTLTNSGGAPLRQCK